MPSLLPEFLQSSAPELTFLRHMEEGMDRARQRTVRRTLAGRHSQGPVFRPLLLGYNGAANTGADVRVIEMLRQFRRIFGHVQFEPVLLASGTHFDHAQFEPLRKLHDTAYFPDFLSESIEDYTGVIACEGSMFTSTFSDSLTGMFAGGMGHAAALGHLSVGYGAEAASMTAPLEKFVKSACGKSLIVARNSDSLRKLQKLGLRTRPGADPAWSFEPAKQADLAMLRQAGWNGTDRVAVLCPINPFCWPLVVDMKRAAAAIRHGVREERQHDAISFHSWSEEAAQKYAAYLSGFAQLARWLRQRGYFPVLVGMQDIDKASCEDVSGLLDGALPVCVRGSNSIDEITGVLHRAALIVSSRYHATVIGMSAGTPCIGVSMDSRIDRLFSENELGDWLLPCHAEHLGEMLIDRAARIEPFSDALTDRYGRLAAQQIRAFGQMGLDVMQEAADTYADFPPSPLPDRWDAYLPPLSVRVEKLLCRYSSDAVVNTERYGS